MEPILERPSRQLPRIHFHLDPFHFLSTMNAVSVLPTRSRLKKLIHRAIVNLLVFAKIVSTSTRVVSLTPASSTNWRKKDFLGRYTETDSPRNRPKKRDRRVTVPFCS